MNPYPKRTKNYKKPKQKYFVRKDNKVELSQIDIFKQVWAERSHICVICGKHLMNFSVNYCHHLLGKGAFPRYKYNPDNIVLLCYNASGTGCHQIWHNEARSILCEDSRWKSLFEIYDSLKEKYNKGE